MGVCRSQCVPFGDLLPTVLSRIGVGRWPTHVLERLLCPLHAGRHHICQDYDLCLVDEAQPADRTLTPHTKANNGDPDRINGVGPQLKDMCLALRPGRGREHFNRLKSVINPRALGGLASKNAAGNKKQQCNL